MKIAAVCAALLASGASYAAAAETLSALQTSAACAVLPASALPRNRIRIIGGQAAIQRHMYAQGDLVVIAGGTNRGLQRDQRHYVRREPARQHGRSGPRAAATTGWLRIVSADEDTAIGQVEFACDGISPGDLLQPYAEPTLPPGADRADPGGQPDFSAAGRVLVGADERTSGGNRDFFLVSMAGIQPGARLAIYREAGDERVPPAAVGEAIVTAAYADTSLVRVMVAHDAIFSGDLVVLRTP